MRILVITLVNAEEEFFGLVLKRFGKEQRREQNKLLENPPAKPVALGQSKSRRQIPNVCQRCYFFSLPEIGAVGQETWTFFPRK